MTGAKRLCMVVHGSYPLGEPRVTREARAALAAGWEVDVVAHRLDGEPAVEEVDGARVVRLPFRHRRGASLAAVVAEYLGFTLAAAVRVASLDHRRRYAVVQVHNPPDFLVGAGVVPRLRGARLVLDVHDLAPDLFELRYGAKPVGRRAVRLLRLVERAALRLADAVVTVHEPYRRELVARGVPPAKVSVVLNSVDETLLPPAEPEPPRNGAFRVVYHGTVTAHYGVESIVEAFAAVSSVVPGATLEIYGTGDAAPAVRGRVDALGLSGSVAIEDRYLPQADVLRAIRSASVGVVSNLPVERNKPALPTKLLEYVAMGIPVVAADLPAVLEHFSPDELRFYAGGDPESLAEALLEVARAPEDAARRAERALARYEAYRWPRYADRYTALLETLRAGARRGGGRRA